MARILLIAAVLFSVDGARAGVLRESAGLVQVRPEGSERWVPAGKPPRILKAGDAVRTGFNARAVVELDGGVRLESAGNTQLALDAAARGGVAVDLLFGSARVTARRLGGLALELRTPTGTARARSDSAAWRATVGAGGGAVFAVEDGLVAVEDARGGVLRLRGGERVETDLAGLHEPEAVPTPARARREEFADRMRRELAMDAEPEAAQRLVSGEMRREEYEAGRVLTDAAGVQVRAEEYVVRTSPSSFEFVTLNRRRGSGMSWYSWSGSYSAALPRDLSSVFADLPGTVGAAAPWTLTSFVETRSNGVDRLVSQGTGGHQVDVNHNSDPTDDVAALYDPAGDTFRNVSGQAVYKTLFDGYALLSDGVLKRSYSGVNVQSQNDATPSAAATINATFPDAGSVREVVLEAYADGSSVQYDNRAVAPGGGVVSRAAFGDATSGPSWQSGLLRSEFEQTTSASEFKNGPIDVILSPRFLIQTSLGLPLQGGGPP